MIAVRSCDSGRVARRLLVMFLVGCGRIAFAPTANDASYASGLDAPVALTWGLVQTTASTSPTLPIAPSGSHHLIVVAVQLSSGGSVASISDDANNGNAYAAIPAARATNPNPPDALELWYAKDSNPGATTISIAATTPVIAAVAWEVSGIRTTDPVDTASTLDAQPATTTPLGPPITTRGPGEFVVSVAIVANGVPGTSAGNEFTNDYRTKGNGWAHLTDPMAAAGSHQAQWDQTLSGTYCASAAAFQVGP